MVAAIHVCIDTFFFKRMERKGTIIQYKAVMNPALPTVVY